MNTAERKRVEDGIRKAAEEIAETHDALQDNPVTQYTPDDWEDIIRKHVFGQGRSA